MNVTLARPILDDLAVTINREHGLVAKSVANAIEHAILAGEALNAAKAIVPWGEWMTWINDNFEMSSGSALIYMQVAKYKDLVAGQPSVAAARRVLLEAIPDERRGEGRRTPRPAYLPQALEMKDAGMTYEQIAEVVGLTPHAIRWQLRPPDLRRKAIKRTMERNREKAAEQRAARKALAREERASVMKKAGGDAFDAWRTSVELAKLLDKLGMNAEYAKCVAIEDALVRRVKES